MKKKIIAICLCVALVAVGIVGATLAYFTDSDQVENTFSVGNVKIDLWEYAGVGEFDSKKTDDYYKFQNGGTYSDIMPGDSMVKAPVIENTGDNAAYVRVFITMNNYEAINNALDEVYEAKFDDDEAKVQAVYDEVFDGWNIMHSRNAAYLTEVKDALRGWMNKTTGEVEDGVELLAIDYVRCPGKDASYQYAWNTFRTESEDGLHGNEVRDDQIANEGAKPGYYADALAKDSRTYILYLKLDANKSYQLFDGLNVPADFTGDQLKMFDGLKIGIYADAIQTANFTATTDEESNVTTEAWINAFNALEAAHHLGWWNTKTAD